MPVSMRLVAAPILVAVLAFAAPAGAVAPPLAATGTSPVASTGNVTFDGTVDPQGQATTYFFQYGTTPTYGSSTLRASVLTGVGPVAVTAVATFPFLPGETYHYRLVAQSRGGTARGVDHVVTLPPPGVPDVSAATVSSISVTSAVLTATVDSGGGRGTCWFELGTTTAYGTSTAPTAFRAGTAHPVRWTTVASNLQPTTTYHFRFVALTGGGTTEGPDETFTTKASTVRPIRGAGPLRMLPPGMRGPLS
jgi:hypothetical protein